MPQFMLEVKAMARPLIPPGKISLSTSQGTRRKGRGGGEQRDSQKAIETEGQPRSVRFVVADQGHVLAPDLQPSEKGLRRNSESLTMVPGSRERDWYVTQA